LSYSRFSQRNNSFRANARFASVNLGKLCLLIGIKRIERVFAGQDADAKS
jgi:hypothetical protein